MTVQLPRHVIPKQLAGGETAYYYNVPTKYRKLKCPVQNEPLGTAPQTSGLTACGNLSRRGKIPWGPHPRSNNMKQHIPAGFSTRLID